ncbi:hypothetical protein A0H76_655 [Hepatospora eriocheir]|uniref:Uncharacterized protein n=1 Tax=Hepatospora eriocheir TaxID=1081669 RepID=A0A1X0QIL5_9MICR|nr:hypothetical protein A0H76_655 [Hepatospora eriocheir]
MISPKHFTVIVIGIDVFGIVEGIVKILLVVVESYLLWTLSIDCKFTLPRFTLGIRPVMTYCVK